MKIFKVNGLKYTAILLLTISTFASCMQMQNRSEITTATKADKYGAYLSELHARGQFNGNALIIENGEMVFQGTFGIGNFDPVDSLELNSVFRLGSVSKQFTAMGIMILKEEGKLSYDQDIRAFIPELPYPGITIRHLLHHTSGLPDYSRIMNEHWKTDLAYDDPEKFIAGNEDILKMLVVYQPPVHFKPGEKWEYSNTGYNLLATIVSRASGEPFHKYLQEQIFIPAGMANTSVYHYIPSFDEQMPNRVFGFGTKFNGVDRFSTDAHYLNAAYGEGGIYSTLEDLMKWDNILYTDVLVSASTIEEAFSPGTLNNGDKTDYGFGWFIDTSPNGKKVVRHMGGWAGFLINIYREIEENNCIITLTNNNSRYFNMDDGLIDILHNQPPKFPRTFIADVIGKKVQNEGITAAIAYYQKLKTEQPDHYIFNEYELNFLGYELLGDQKIDEAIGIFKLNQEEYPQSANVYDSYGDALLAQGDTAHALSNFKKVEAIDSTFFGIKKKIDALEANAIPGKASNK
ncbi:serine hydrolase domain-containing protein [Flavilitoribacter nigricans]|nr:serine hydrolase domain-containing protein [Flavilitoribacter nigricans]